WPSLCACLDLAPTVISPLSLHDALPILAGVLYGWWNGVIAPDNVGLGATVDLLIVAVIGGLGRVEGAWIGAFAFVVINNYVRDVDRKSTRLNSSHQIISYAVFCLKKKTK